MPGPAILCRDVAKRFPDGTEALRGVSFAVPQGEIAAVIGPSGAGKSTLLRCINGLIAPTSGSVETLGEAVSNKGSRGRAIRRRVGMVFQSFNLIPRLTVLQNALVGRLGYKPIAPSLFFRFTADETDKALAALDRVGLANEAWKPASQLSGGQMQRVAIARALVQDPPLILADEPVSNLDPVIARSVLAHLVQICREDGRTVLLNLHAVDLVRLAAERVIGVRAGLVVYDGPVSGLEMSVLKRIYGEEYSD
ncbi:MAG: phosphonate ABC transporter ATP-binding protein [bacterium]|jgi:phosphonate transport system ATP-binding protein